MKRWMQTSLCLLVLVATLNVPVWAEGPESGTGGSVTPFRYAYVGETQAPVYPAPGDPAQMVPVRYASSPNTWVSIKDTVQVDRRVWYRIGREEYVLGIDVFVASPSAFRGMVVDGIDQSSLGFVVAENLNVRARPGVAPDNPPLSTLSRYSAVRILEHETAYDGIWYRIGTNEYVHGSYVRVVTPTPRPTGVAPGEKWMAIDLSSQTLAAYEGDRMVFATLVSTGLPWWPTPEGLFRIWAKIETGKMSGGSVEAGDYYYLQDVPWAMYFHRGYGLHGAYWHDRFGDPRSRGCVNLSPRDARWLFDWTSPLVPEGRDAMLSSDGSPGTWVYVYHSETAYRTQALV